MLVDGLPVFHLVARVEVKDVSLCAFDVGCWLWERLREAFPFALSVCLMLDHLHLLSPLADPDAARMRLNRLLGHLARRLGVRYVGEAAEPTLVRDRPKLLRELRYVDLNPPRAGLTDDPLAWIFGTHRDVVGASVDPWIDAARLARAVGRSETGFGEWYHAYVSADPSVNVVGSPPPRAVAPRDIPEVPLGRIARAAAAATRSRMEAIRATGPTRRLRRPRPRTGLARHHPPRPRVRLRPTHDPADRRDRPRARTPLPRRRPAAPRRAPLVEALGRVRTSSPPGVGRHPPLRISRFDIVGRRGDSEW